MLLSKCFDDGENLQLFMRTPWTLNENLSITTICRGMSMATHDKKMHKNIILLSTRGLLVAFWTIENQNNLADNQDYV